MKPLKVKYLLGSAVMGLSVFGVLGAATPAQASTTSAQGQLSSLHDGYVASVTAPNGDVNPYSLAVVPLSLGNLVKGNVLVADFNSSSTVGAGTTILQVNPTTGATSIFFHDTTGVVVGPVGLTINPTNDVVWAGDYGPATSGSYTGANGNVTAIKPTGAILATFNGATTTNTPSAAAWQGVWGQAMSDTTVNGATKVSFYWGTAGNSAGSGGGVWRVDPLSNVNGQPLGSSYVQLATAASIPGSGSNATNAAGPQGVVFDNSNNTLYVADDSNNTIYAIAGANTASGLVTPVAVPVASGNLNSPQNLTINPTNGDLLVVNGAANNNLLEINPTTGAIDASRMLTYNEPAGSLFGLATTTNANGQLVVYYDDANSNSLHALTPESGYRLFASDGGVFSDGGAGYYGSMGGTTLNAPVVGGVSSSSTHGYWMVASDGGIFSFGDAHFYGSMGGKTLNRPIVGMSATPDGQGYWMVASDGGVFSFGDATFYGSMGGKTLNAPIVGMVPTPDGLGYWLVASDGGIFSFGDAHFYGSMGGKTLNRPIVGMSATPDGQGYWMVASDGGVFSFGDATFYGSTGGIKLNAPVVGMAATADGMGYSLVASDGGIFSFGDSTFYGSQAGSPLNKPIVGLGLSF